MSKAIGEISTAALAYLGDSVLEVCVREMLVKKGVSSAKKNVSASVSSKNASRSSANRRVNAVSQAFVSPFRFSFASSFISILQAQNLRSNDLRLLFFLFAVRFYSQTSDQLLACSR